MVDTFKEIENTPENNQKNIEDLVLSTVQVANIMNKHALAGKSDSWKYLDMIKDIRLGKDGLGKDIVITFIDTEEVDIQDWNKEVDNFNQYRFRDIKAFKEAVKVNVLLSDIEKEGLLGLNEEALKVIARNMRDLQEEEEEIDQDT